MSWHCGLLMSRCKLETRLLAVQSLKLTAQCTVSFNKIHRHCGTTTANLNVLPEHRAARQTQATTDSLPELLLRAWQHL